MSEVTLRIGQVANLSGLSLDTIRIWERRYSAVVPDRDASNTRKYRTADVERLTMLRRLTESGYRIGDVANLPDDELQSRLDAATTTPHRDTGHTVSLITVGDQLTTMLANDPTPGLLIVASTSTLDELAALHVRPPAGTLLVVQLATVGGADAQAFLKARTRANLGAALLLYDFGQREALSSLREDGVMTARATNDVSEVRQLILARASWALPSGGAGDAPKPVFSPAQLQKVAALQDVVDCECPRHMSDLITSLQAFEGYSAECEQRFPADAAMHQMLGLATAHARHTVETALERLILSEGMSVEGHNHRRKTDDQHPA